MLRKCIICGKYFEPKKSNQNVCSAACKYERKKIMMRLYYNYLDFAIDNIIDNEEIWDEPPSKEEIISMIILLHECGVQDFDDIPTFKSRNMMSRYKHDKIQQVFTNCSKNGE